jgi:hypothetical protein
MPRPSAAAEVVFEGIGQNGAPWVRVAWDGIHGDPVETSVFLDGSPVEHTSLERVDLPTSKPGMLHHLDVELLFAGGRRVRVQDTFGLESESVTTDLTAYPVRLKGKRPRKRALEDPNGWLLSKGRALPVEAIEGGRAEIVVVRDARALASLRELARLSAHRGLSAPLGMALETGERLRMIGTRSRPATSSNRGAYDVFPFSRTFFGKEVDLSWAIGLDLEGPQGRQRLADAVAAAGVAASSARTPRVVVLILSADPHDGSHWSLDTVKGYLRAIHVPLVVWTVARTRPGTLADYALPSKQTPWGVAADISTPRSLSAAVTQLRKQLERQRVLWVSGQHLLADIEVAETAPVEALR